MKSGDLVKTAFSAAVAVLIAVPSSAALSAGLSKYAFRSSWRGTRTAGMRKTRPPFPIT